MATPQLPLPLVTTQKPTKPTPLTDTYPISRFSCCWPSAANNFNSLSLMCSCQLFLMAPWQTMGVAGICLLTETYYSHFVYFSGHVLWPIVSWFTIHYGHSKYFYIFLFLLFCIIFYIYFYSILFDVLRWTCKLYFDVGALYVSRDPFALSQWTLMRL